MTMRRALALALAIVAVIAGLAILTSQVYAYAYDQLWSGGWNGTAVAVAVVLYLVGSLVLGRRPHARSR